MLDSKTRPSFETPRNFAGMLAPFSGAAKQLRPDSSALGDDAAIIGAAFVRRNHPLADRRPALTPYPPLTQNPRKTSSISLRLTAYEERQLRTRAVEAQLSLSDYLRSCIFEAESLRSQVKEALSQMREAAAKALRPLEEKQLAHSEQRGSALFAPDADNWQLKAEN